MEVLYKDNNAYITDIKNGFIPQQVFENGQCFRFKRLDDGNYNIIAKDKFINVARSENDICLSPCGKKDFESFWRSYFDLNSNYIRLFSDVGDKYLKSAMLKYPGLKVLKQDPFETLISFIISANNNIGRIKGIIEKICVKYGRRIEAEAGGFYAFPEPEALAGATEDELKELGCGYRASYVADTAKEIDRGFDLISLKDLDYSEAKKQLMSLKGVGPKVADCILLFSLEHYNAFPKDVWVKRVMNDLYGIKGSDKDVQSFAEQKFGKYAGIAQQYLFYAARRGELHPNI